MPEGPSIVILKEATQQFVGKKVLEVEGNSKQPIQQALGKKVTSIQSWGKHFLMGFSGFTIRIHFMLFGTYRINENKEAAPRLTLKFKNGFIHFYACSVQFLEGDPDNIYDWTADILSEHWDAKKARKKLKTQPETLLCDALLDQHIFAGAGNIIKNEVLYRTRLHPENAVGKLPAKKLNQLIQETRNYAFDFLRWKKAFELKKHWQAHTKKTCMRCNLPFIKAYLGKNKRRSFFCTNCQILYD